MPRPASATAKASPRTRIATRRPGLLPAVKYLVEELGADVNAADHEGNTAAAPRRVARRQRDDSVTWSRRAPTSSVNRAGRHDRRHGERPRAAHAAVSRNDQAARRPGREEQSPVHLVLKKDSESGRRSGGRSRGNIVGSIGLRGQLEISRPLRPKTSRPENRAGLEPVAVACAGHGDDARDRADRGRHAVLRHAAIANAARPAAFRSPNFDAAKTEPNSEVTEKMIRKLRAGMMPPAGTRGPKPP